ncbi:hypothetical protein GCM10007874_38080 [Labrys miyagiensis]|uniref:Uncharacterized protein n=2 Tax=Labrys miyagiensis TaxID=346912 RepID=A0ABQ6CKH5_9HYPH|nr:hypothetical protein GCM10007874_38080 [Labrys miyagiensis]
MVMVNADFVKGIKRLAANTKFAEICSIKPQSSQRQKDVEYVSRLLVHAYYDYDNESDVEEFLDARIIDALKEVDFKEFEERFEFTVSILYELFGAKALFPNAGTVASQGERFSLRSLETVFVGILRNAGSIEKLQDPGAFIKEKVLTFWKQPEVESMSASGLRGTQRLQRTIPFGAMWFKPSGN